MYSVHNMNHKEQRIARHIDKYFKSADMSFYDKLFNAMLIAQHELEGHHFSSEKERQKIIEFTSIIDSLLKKINP